MNDAQAGDYIHNGNGYRMRVVKRTSSPTGELVYVCTLATLGFPESVDTYLVWAKETRR